MSRRRRETHRLLLRRASDLARKVGTDRCRSLLRWRGPEGTGRGPVAVPGCGCECLALRRRSNYRVRPWDAGCARCGIGDVSRACAKRAQQRRELRQGTVLSRFWVSGSIRVRQEADRQAGC